MGQQDVFDFLQDNNKRWYTSKEIAKELELSMGSVTSTLKKLRKSDSICFELNGTGGKKNYRYSSKKNTIRTILSKIGLR